MTVHDLWGAARDSTPVASRHSSGDDGGMEARVAKIEEHVSQLCVDMGAIKERLNHVPTKHEQ